MKKNIIYIIIIILLVITSIFIGSKYYQENQKVKSLKQETSELTISMNLYKDALKNLTSSENSNVFPITYSQFSRMTAEKNSFIVVISQATCINCIKYIPSLNRILNDHSLIAYELDLLTLTNEEYNDFLSLYNINFTPVTVFIKNGQEVSSSNRIIGNVSEEKIINELKNNNYIN